MAMPALLNEIINLCTSEQDSEISAGIWSFDCRLYTQHGRASSFWFSRRLQCDETNSDPYTRTA